MSKAVKLGISIGDTNGVGLEVILKSFQDKVIKIFIHGFLHLLKFDHIKNKDYKNMLREEDRIYKSIISKKN